MVSYVERISASLLLCNFQFGFIRWIFLLAGILKISWTDSKAFKKRSSKENLDEEKVAPRTEISRNTIF